MSFTVTNLQKIDIYVSMLNVDETLSKWLSKFLKKEIVNREDWLKLSNVKKSTDPHVQRSVDASEDIYDVVLSSDMDDEVKHVVDWIVGLRERDERLFGKLSRITWKQAVEHSKRWHDELARKSEKLKDETIVFDENCPVVFKYDDGMKWVWLKTDKARDDEGRVMGHCVGQGGHDDLRVDEGVFSLRDSHGRPHITMFLNEFRIIQKVGKKNSSVSFGYEKYFDFFDVVKLRLSLCGDPRKIIEDGEHRRRHFKCIVSDQKLHSLVEPSFVFFDNLRPSFNIKWISSGFFDCFSSNGTETVLEFSGWYRNGLLHREDGPAVLKLVESMFIEDMSIENFKILKNRIISNEWFFNGQRHRMNGPAIERSDGTEEFWINGVKLFG